MTTDIGGVLKLVLATWGKAAGLTRSEAGLLYAHLMTRPLPETVDQAWVQLEEATLAIRRSREQS